MRRLVTLLAVALTCLCSAHAEAAGQARDNFQVVALVPGLGNRVRGAAFFPVVVELGSRLETVSGVISIETSTVGEAQPRYVVPYQVSPGTSYRYFLYPHCVSATDGFVVVIRDASGGVLRREELLLTAAETESYLVAVIGAEGVAGLSKRASSEKMCGMDVAFLAKDFMPTKACGYDTADAVVWPHPDPAGMKPEQESALRDWVLCGGRLVLGVGDAYMAAGASFLKDLVPGRVTGVANITEFGQLARFAKTPLFDATPMAAAVLRSVRGEVLAEGSGYPLVARGKVGFGEVIFLAFDPTRSPFAKWDGAPEFWDNLLGLAQSESSSEPAARDAGRSAPSYMRGYSGGHDPVGSLSAVMNRFAGIKPVSFFFVVWLLGGYVLLVGPVDYFVLKKLKHLEWTWFTFPAIALVAAATAFMAVASARSGSAFVNQVTVEDYSADGEAQRWHSVSALIAPENRHVGVSFAVPGAELWIGQNRSQFRAGGLGTMASYPCDFVDDPGEGSRIVDLFMPVWSPETFWGRWRGGGAEPPLSVQLRLGSEALSGTLTNESGGSVESVTVIHRSGCYSLGTMAPGDSAHITPARVMPYDTFLKGYSDAYDYAYSSPSAHARCWPEALRVVMAASFARDRRFYPAECHGQAAATLSASNARDMIPELSVRQLVDAGQAVIVCASKGVRQPIRTSVGNPDRSEWTVHRICARVEPE